MSACLRFESSPTWLHLLLLWIVLNPHQLNKERARIEY